LFNGAVQLGEEGSARAGAYPEISRTQEISMRLFNRTADEEPVVPADQTLLADELKQAYREGRRDERARRKSHPFIAMAVVGLALVGGTMLFLAAKEGSFSTAGQVADEQLAVAAAEAGPALQDTADRAGEALKEAGADLKDRGQAVVDRPAN